MILRGPFLLEILYDLMTVIGPLPISPQYTGPIGSSVLPAEHLQGWEKTFCADRDQKCLSDGCSLLPRMPLLATQGVFCWNRGKKTKSHSQRPGAGRCWASPVWSIWSLLLGSVPWNHLAFCSPSPTLSTGSAHAHQHELHCPSPLLPLLTPGGCYHVQKGRRRQNKHSQESHNIAAVLPGNRL